MTSWVSQHVHIGPRDFELRVHDQDFPPEVVELSAAELGELLTNILLEYGSTIIPASMAVELYDPIDKTFGRINSLHELPSGAHIRLVPADGHAPVDYAAEEREAARQIAVIVEYYAKFVPGRRIDEVVSIVTTRCQAGKKCLIEPHFAELCQQLAAKYGEDPQVVHAEAIRRGAGLPIDNETDVAFVAAVANRKNKQGRGALAAGSLSALEKLRAATVTTGTVATIGDASALQDERLFGHQTRG